MLGLSSWMTMRLDVTPSGINGLARDVQDGWNMKSLRHLVHGSYLVAITFVAMACVGCATRERVVRGDRPAVVRVYAPEPVVRERIVIRP